MVVELLYLDGCPGVERLRPVVRRLTEERGARLRERRIVTPRDADAHRFLGSPTVRVDGLDVEPGVEGRTDHGLKCRLYRIPGGLSGRPPDDWLRAAIGRGSG
jgi:hypothetical protein